MSLKGVELQIAIPKTFDAGKIADQHQQKNILLQMHANEALKKEIERKQLSVNETEGMDGIKNEEEDTSQDTQPSLEQENKKKQELEQKAQHPFKGNLFDSSG